MSKQDLIDKLAKKMAEDRNYCRRQTGMVEQPWAFFKRDAGIAVDMFWPLVDATDRLNEHGSRCITEVLNAWMRITLTRSDDA